MNPALQLAVDAEQLCADSTETREQAWKVLCEEHYSRLYRLVCRFGVHPAEIEDVVQRALVIALEQMKTADVVDPAAWLRGITVNVVLHHLRWRRLRDAKQWLIKESPITAAPVITPEQGVAAAEEISLVRHTLNQMSPKLRNVLVLCDIEELKLAEVSQVLAIPLETVRSRRRLAKKKFLTIWESEQS